MISSCGVPRYLCGTSSCVVRSHLVLQGSQVSLQTLMFAEEGLNTGQVTAKVV